MKKTLFFCGIILLSIGLIACGKIGNFTIAKKEKKILEVFNEESKLWFCGRLRGEEITKNSEIESICISQRGEIYKEYRIPTASFTFSDIEGMTDFDILEYAKNNKDDFILDEYAGYKPITAVLLTDSSGKEITGEIINGLSCYAGGSIRFEIAEILRETKILDTKYVGFIGRFGESDFYDFFVTNQKNNEKFKYDEIGDENTELDY